MKARTRSWISSRGSWRRGPHCRSSLLLNGGDDAPRGSAVRCLQILATSLRSVPILNSSKYLEVENLGVACGGRRNESSVKELEDSIANVGKLGFDLGSVGTNHGDMARCLSSPPSARWCARGLAVLCLQVSATSLRSVLVLNSSK